MRRADKVQLLNDIKSGKKNLADLKEEEVDLSKLTSLELSILAKLYRKYTTFPRLQDAVTSDLLGNEEKEAVQRIATALEERPTGYIEAHKGAKNLERASLSGDLDELIKRYLEPATTALLAV